MEWMGPYDLPEIEIAFAVACIVFVDINARFAITMKRDKWDDRGDYTAHYDWGFMLDADTLTSGGSPFMRDNYYEDGSVNRRNRNNVRIVTDLFNLWDTNSVNISSHDSEERFKEQIRESYPEQK